MERLIDRAFTRRSFLQSVGLGALGMVLLPSLRGLSQQGESPLALAAKVELPEVGIGGLSVRATGLWAQGNIAGIAAGPLIHVIDFTDVKAPAVTTITIDGECLDLFIEGNLLYAGLQRSPNRNNTLVLIYDISDPKAPKLIGRLESLFVPAGVHNIFLAGKVVFLAEASRRGRLHLVDVSDPTKPTYLADVRDPQGQFNILFVHDVTVIGNRAYVSCLTNGFFVVEFENLDKPSELRWKILAQHTYAGLRSSTPFTHSAWPSTDGQVLFTTDEREGELVRAWDISDLTKIQLLASYSASGNPRSIPHNIAVDGSFLYVAYYTEGLKVLDVSSPKELKEVASFDPDPTPPAQLFSGAWDVYPFEKYVLVSDMDIGLLILEKRGVLTGRR